MFQYMSYETIRSARLVCKLFADIGAKYLIKKVTLLYDMDSLQKTSEIAAHPIVSTTITSLYYKADQLPRFSTFSAWFLSPYLDDTFKREHQKTLEKQLSRIKLHDNASDDP